MQKTFEIKKESGNPLNFCRYSLYVNNRLYNYYATIWGAKREIKKLTTKKHPVLVYKEVINDA